jgi:diguanylate cyclase (GGDEF)-like protein/PAS domain S-box-containing protein
VSILSIARYCIEWCHLPAQTATYRVSLSKNPPIFVIGIEHAAVRVSLMKETVVFAISAMQGFSVMIKRYLAGVSVIVLLASIYFAAGRFGLSLAFVNVSATPVWPPTGIALAALLIFGYRAWPGVFLGALAVNITTADSVSASIMIAAGNTTEALLGAYLINQFAHGAHVFERASDIFYFIVIVLFATALAASIGVASLLLTRLAVADDVIPVWFTWWLGDATGAFIVAPVITLWVNAGVQWSKRLVLEASVWALSLAFTGLVVFGNLLPEGLRNYPLGFLILPFIIWSAFRLGRRGAATATLILSAIAIWGTRAGNGPFALYGDNESLLLLQIFMAFMAMTGLILAAVVAERRRREESEHWLATIVESSSDAIIGKNLDGIVLSWNQAAERMYGYTTSEMVGNSISVLVPPDRPNEVTLLLDQIRRGERIEHFETVRRCKDGKQINVSLTISPIKDAGGIVNGASVIARDITERRRTEERIRYLAQHDALTGLPNRVLFRDRIGQAIVQARRHHQLLAVLFLDLDGFKHINDSLGHQIGDHLLRMTARRLQRCLREGDTIARLGGDEFVMCLPGLNEGNDAMPVAAKILDTLRESFYVEQHELHVSGSIGISLYPSDGEDAEVLMRSADTAMYHAKENGRNNYQFFTARLNEAARRRLVIANLLHQALERNEFTLYYQPQVNLESGRISAAEALVRWHQPELGEVLPSEFIKVAEETGLIVQLGEWVLRRACERVKRWRDTGYPQMRVTVNLSPQQFRRAGFAESTAKILEENNLPASALELEITESVLMMQSAENLSILQQLAAMGIHMAIDDFGVGYSSLAYLQRFPIDTLKIDRSFVSGIGHDKNDTALVTAIIAMAQSLQLTVVGEGVESADQAAFLKAHGCRAGQGFYFGEPVSADAFDELLRTEPTNTSEVSQFSGY